MAIYEKDPQRYIDMAYECRIEGLSVLQMCRKMDIHPATFYSWVKKYPEFKKTYEQARYDICIDIENELFKSCREHSVEEVTITKNADGTKQEISRYRIIPANVASIKYYLGNRAGSDWKNPDHVIEETSDEIIVRIPKFKKTEESTEESTED